MARSILDLPLDILLLILPYLDAKSFLRLTSTCKALRQPQLLHDAQFWSTVTRRTFRVPNQPVVQNDGRRWQKLYKRLLTQTRVYTWGNNEMGCLGQALDCPDHPCPQRVSWPCEMSDTRRLGVIADLQCGGWSTSLLTADGLLFNVGVIDGRHDFRGTTRAAKDPVLLRFPHKFPTYDLRTTITQFSAGRAHVLALSDSGRIWSWSNALYPAYHIKFLHHDTKEDGSRFGQGRVKKVVAGWSKSAALVEGVGIVVWDPPARQGDFLHLEDTALILETAVVPRSGYTQARSKSSLMPASSGRTPDDLVGEVLSIVVLESVILFTTHVGKVFAAHILQGRIAEPIELKLTDESDASDAAFATDVQGSFQSFAVFTRSGAVLTSSQGRLLSLLLDQPLEQLLFSRIPALQQKNIVKIAFGDHHFHALHSPGYITSYGREPESCGALGLGGHGTPEGRLRGIRYRSRGGDGRLVPHAYSEGRRVWFEPKKRHWIRFLTAGGADPAEARGRVRMALGHPDVRCQGEVSEWVEQEGRDWASKFGVRGDDDDDDALGPYFALSVAAAGWHSGALVLVNDDLAEKVSRACEMPIPNHVHESDPLPSSGSGSLVGYAISLVFDYGRWFLGLPPHGRTPASRSPSVTGRVPSTVNNYTSANAQTGDFARESCRCSEGGPSDGFEFVWADDHFPRLKLTDGTEMPGSVPFDIWRYERPEFDLDLVV